MMARVFPHGPSDIETPRLVGEIVRSYVLDADATAIRFRLVCPLCDQYFQIGDEGVITTVKVHRTSRPKLVHKQPCYEAAPKING